MLLLISIRKLLTQTNELKVEIEVLKAKLKESKTEKKEEKEKENSSKELYEPLQASNLGRKESFDQTQKSINRNDSSSKLSSSSNKIESNYTPRKDLKTNYYLFADKDLLSPLTKENNKIFSSKVSKEFEKDLNLEAEPPQSLPHNKKERENSIPSENVDDLKRTSNQIFQQSFKTLNTSKCYHYIYCY